MTDREQLCCDCTEPFHHVVFDYDEEYGSLLIYQQMDHYLPWHQRLWVALDYFLGRDKDRVQYTEVVLDKDNHNESVRTIRDMLNKVLGE
jgi:hypothetical protein